MLKVWDWMSGKLLADIPVLSVAESYIKVKAPKRKRGWDDGDGNGDGDADGGADGEQNRKGKGRRGRGKGKSKGKAEARQESAGAEDPSVKAGEAQDADDSGDQPMATPDANPPPSEEDKATSTPEQVLVFVVHKISSVDRGEHGRFLLFNAVGYVIHALARPAPFVNYPVIQRNRDLLLSRV